MADKFSFYVGCHTNMNFIFAKKKPFVYQNEGSEYEQFCLTWFNNNN